VVAMVYVGSRFADPEPLPDGAAPAEEPGRKAGIGPLVAVIGLVMLAATANPLQEDIGNPSLLLWPAAGLLLWILFRRYGAGGGEGSGDSAQVAASYRRIGGVLVLLVAPLVLAAGPWAAAARLDDG